MEYPIKPSDINYRAFLDVFECSGTAVSAGFLVKMAQQNGSWRDFTKEEIDKVSKQDFCFYFLLDDGIYPSIKQNKDGSYSFTHKFIAKCFLSSPATDVVIG